jgi:glycosyltransferase involved in cell wall biosynthesis
MTGQAPPTRPKAFTVFTLGDSRKISTWSNVPYLFTRALERYGFTVVRVNIGQYKLLQAGYDLFWRTLRALGFTRTKHNFFRSRTNQLLTRWTMERAMRRHPRNHNLFMTFSFGANRRQREFTLFCDMTFEKSIAYFEGRPADRLEMRSIRKEEENLEHARLIVSLFPELAEELREEYGDKVKYYGNVVNIEAPEVDPEALLRKGERSVELVFIGKEHYKKGLLLLLDAMPLINAGRTEPVKLHVIGLTRMHIRGPVPEHVTFHGYLNKGDEEERKRYYEILKRATLFVNPNVKWGAFSASLEAMFLYTPVVLFPYPEFTRTFGEEERVGLYLKNEDSGELARSILKLSADRTLWRERALNAHDSVKDFTWDNYVGRYLADLGLLGPDEAPPPLLH